MIVNSQTGGSLRFTLDVHDVNRDTFRSCELKLKVAEKLRNEL